MRTARLFLLLSLFGCSFDPNIPSARVLCQRLSECPRGFTCEPVMEAALVGIKICCRQPGCSAALNPDELRRIQAAAEGKPDGGTRSDGGGGGVRMCGNGNVETGELCDPPQSCPATCPAIGCTKRKLEGSAASCTARCVDDGQQTQCMSGDSCCPSGCTQTTDRDCACTCGNGVKEESCGETCDPAQTCPTACPAEGCNLRRLLNAGTCQATCVREGMQTACLNGDGCCPSSCNATNDNDCKPTCGNGVVEAGERCDPLMSCPASCPQLGCDLFRLQGNSCQAECVRTGSQTMCKGGDGCCPPGCNSRNDPECPPGCGNGVVEVGEQCDPVSACQMASDACTSDASTVRTRMGQVGMCTFRCQSMPRPCRAMSDGFCPAACMPCEGTCGASQDIDCRLGDGAVCTQANQCQNSCTDGHCCRQSCPVCQACTGAGGICEPLPVLSKDNVPAGACAGPSSCDGSTSGPMACKLDNGQPCMADGQCASGACTPFFRDGDGDGQAGTTGTRFCGTNPPAGFQAMAGPDCCDSDASVKQGESGVMFFTMPSACGTFDYDCASGEQKQSEQTALCDLVLCRSGWAPAPGAGVPACGQTADFIECVRHNIGETTFCDQGPANPKVQGCR